MGVRGRSAVQHGVRLGQLRGRRVRVRAMSHAAMVVYGRLLDRSDRSRGAARSDPACARGSVDRQFPLNTSSAACPATAAEAVENAAAAPSATTLTTTTTTAAGDLIGRAVHQSHPGSDRLRVRRLRAGQEVRRARSRHRPDAGLRTEPSAASDIHRARRRPDHDLLREQRQTRRPRARDAADRSGRTDRGVRRGRCRDHGPRTDLVGSRDPQHPRAVGWGADPDRLGDPARSRRTPVRVPACWSASPFCSGG